MMYPAPATRLSRRWQRRFPPAPRCSKPRTWRTMPRVSWSAKWERRRLAARNCWKRSNQFNVGADLCVRTSSTNAMSYDSETDHHRRSHRLRGYDYSFPAPYFVTLCSQNGVCLFGEVKNDQMLLNEAGEMVRYWLAKIPEKFPAVFVDSFSVIPNHLPAILINL